MHHKEKSVALLREIDEVLSRNKPETYFVNSKEFLSFSQGKKTSIDNEKNKEKTMKNMNIQEQIDNSFKNLSIQTINALISLKSDVNNKQTPEFETAKSLAKTRNRTEKTEENLKYSAKKIAVYKGNTPEKSLNKSNSSQKKENYKGKIPLNEKNVNEITLNAQKRIEEMMRNLKSSKSLDDLTKGLKEKLQNFEEAYENINHKIDDLLVKMKPENKSPKKNETLGGDFNTYTFQKKKMNSGEKVAKKFEPFMN